MNHLPPHLRDIAREEQDAELARSVQEKIFRNEAYLRGWYDCADGKEHNSDCPDYTRGYNDRYAYEQELSHET